MRTIVDLTETQLARLARVAEKEGISRAEAVRRAVDVAYARDEPEKAVSDVRRPALGLWKGRRINSVAHVAALRKEWER